jgi:hypothetical protein
VAPQLTSFSGASVVTVPVCNAASMIAITPGTLWYRLRTLFIVVLCLTGGTVAGAALGGAQDNLERRRVVLRLCQPELGFCCGAEDSSDTVGFCSSGPSLWLWGFQLLPLREGLAIDAPAGSAVALSAVMGLPFVRLRAALPDEWFVAPLGAALGRAAGLSARGLAAALPEQTRVLHALGSRHGSGSGGQAACSGDSGGARAWGNGSCRAAAAGTPHAPHDDSAQQHLEQLVGTAMVLSFMQVAQLMRVVELSAHVRAADRHFERLGAATPAGMGFEELRLAFLNLLSPGVLDCGRGWLPRARLWKLILSQRRDGSWAADGSVAFAVGARDPAEACAAPVRAAAVVKLLNAARGFFESLETGPAGGRSLSKAVSAASKDAAGSRATQDDLADYDAGLQRLGVNAHAVADADDCPLSNRALHLAASVPRRLAEAADDDASCDAERVWATMCAIRMLERLPFCWLWGDGEAYYERERTIVDAAREWLEEYAAQRPALAAALDGEDGAALWARARHSLNLWRHRSLLRVAELRTAPAIRAQAGLSWRHRGLASVLRAVLTKHNTASIFLSEAADGLRRWQSACATVCGLACAGLRRWLSAPECHPLTCHLRRVRHRRVRCGRAAADQRVDVLRQGAELLRRVACGAGGGLPRHLPARRPLPRLRRRLRRPDRPVCHAARAAGLSRRPGRLQVHRLSG